MQILMNHNKNIALQMQPKNEENKYGQLMPTAQTLNTLKQLPSAQFVDNMFNQRRCRICLEQEGYLTQLPCSCLGDIGLVHEECFSKWITSLRNDRYGIRSHGQSLFHVQDDLYEIPCEICRSNIKIEMRQKRKCFKCEDIKKADKCMSLFCIIFMVVVIGVVLFLCITNLVNNSNNDAVRKLVIIIIMFVFIITLGCLIKRQVSRMMIKYITKLKIITQKVTNSRSTQRSREDEENQNPSSNNAINPYQHNLNALYQNNPNNSLPNNRPSPIIQN